MGIILIKNQNIKKSEVYNYLRDSWEHISDPVNIIEELEIFQNAFIDLVSGTNLQCHDKDIELSFNNLTRSKIPTSTYPFLVQLSNSIVEKKTNKKDALEILACVESFLVRRALCGFEPTGLHAVFKRLWVDCGGAATKSKVISAIKKHKTVAWPDNAEVKQAIAKRSLYNSAITPYFLVQYDKSLAGDYPDTMPWIEHVLPTTMSPAWQKDFNKDQHDDLKDTLANLKLPNALGKQTGIVTITIQAKKFKSPAIRCAIHSKKPNGSQIKFVTIFSEDFTSLKSSTFILFAFL